ncbi:hypothetical protein [Methyloraptor flagellatus]|jgi:hypothetical protein|uniref:Tail fiber assembly protein n=1 Tax=Methyloraptor flagellatus TaxID=3162530 RepID=A0AAU7X419_9HYPH
MYRATSTEAVFRADGAIIPADPDNRDWQAYLAWLADGNAPEPAAAPEPTPAAVSARRAEALAALAASDIVVLRRAELGLALPEDWRTYRIALRAVVSGAVDTLPERPPWPPTA